MQLLIDSHGHMSAKEIERQLDIGYRAARRIRALLMETMDFEAWAHGQIPAEERFLRAIQRCAPQASTAPGSRPPSGPAGFSGQSADSPEAPLPESPRGQLPVSLDRFVGRQSEITAVRRQLDRGRLVTLSGDGGCGKSRLALEVATKVAAQYEHGAWWVDLALIDRDDSVSAAVADALRLHEQPQRSRADALAGQLRDRSMLVVFDNCEHVLNGSADVILLILKSGPGVRALATSREPLSLEGEIVWRVAGLSTPGPEEESPPEVLARFDAVALFADRAKAAKPSFALSPANARAVTQVCRQLDGIPLAIELAAARVSALTPQQIARALGDSFALLTWRRRPALPRHQTLRASMDWSYQLLEEDEQVVFRRLAVFPASFSPEAASEIWPGPVLGDDYVLPVLFRLVDKSLVVVEEHGCSHRYRLLQTVRQFAMERLDEAGETDDARARHMHHALSLVERAPPGSSAEYQPEWLDVLDTERPSLRAALDWAIANSDAGSALRLVGALAMFYATRGRALEGQRWFTDALAVDQPSPLPSTARARALWGAAFVDANMSDYRAAGDKAIAALDLAQTAGDGQIAGRALDLLGLIQVNRNPAQARIHLSEAATLAEKLGDDWCLAHALQLIAWSWTIQSAVEPARLARARSLRFIERQGSAYFLAWHWLGEAMVDRWAGDLTALREAAAQAQRYAAAAADPICQAWAAACQADLSCMSGASYAATAQQAIYDLDARLHLSAASGLAAALVHLGLGRCALALAKLPDAEQQLHLAIDAGREGQGPAIRGYCLIYLADICLLQGRVPEARNLASGVSECATSLDSHWQAASASVIRARCALAEGDLDTARSMCRESLAVQAEQGYKAEALPTLHLIAATCACREMYQQAARLFAAAGAAGRRLGIRRCPVDSLRHRSDRDLVARSLDLKALRGLVAEGSALTLDEAIDYASRGWGVRKRPQSGWESLTRTELAVVRLVADGLTNADIASKMLIAPATVKAHLSHIFTKTGVSHRAELAATATRLLTSPKQDGSDQKGP